MISLKRFIDNTHTSATLLQALVDAYKQTLIAFGASAGDACPSVGSNLSEHLARLGHEMAAAESPDAIILASTRVSSRLEEWADEAEEDLRKKTADVKELLVTLAHTAASVAASDAEHVMRFEALTVRLEKIASLNDVTQLRSAVLASTNELRASVETMSKSTRVALKEMQSELSTYQSKLEAAEKVAAHDPLTGLLNRRKIESLLERRIQRGQTFSVGIIDLDGFKGINDKLGHRAGDDLLRQFSTDLKSNARPTDIAGRWGGDEFIVVIDGSAEDARSHFSRVSQWIGGTYTIQSPQGPAKVAIELSIGIAEWKTGFTATELIEEADRRMYASKRARR